MIIFLRMQNVNGLWRGPEDAYEVERMRIAIAGAGMAGSYVLRLLNEKGKDEVVLFDEVKTTGCGQRPCAWGMAPSIEYRRLVGRFLDPERYVNLRSDRVKIDGITMGADLLTVDKPSLIKDMVGGAQVRHGALDPDDYDLVVDATGVERAYLGKVEGDDLIAELCQYRLGSENDLGTWLRTSTWGYGWCFPLGNGEYHVGYGNLPPHVGAGMDTIDSTVAESRVKCKCASRIRLSSPHHTTPLVRDNIVGVGESIGAVGPMGGDGNLYAMQCAEMLVENLGDLDMYQEEVLRRFEWMRKERVALVNLLAGRRPSPSDVRVFVRHARRVGFTMNPVQALKFIARVGGA
jgi:flavin-dependent dehydrogenase